jgi:hypothetical protein
VTPLGSGAAEIRNFFLFWVSRRSSGEICPDFDGIGQQIDGIVKNGSLPGGVGE